ncbi:MAG: SMP-30/gluconolactonase/LRE family protein [Alphaproteobacteria bacterium]
MTGFSIAVDDLEFLGIGLKRPECVLCTKAGALFVSDWCGGVTRIDPDGGQVRFLAPSSEGLRPNGMALSRDGSFLIAHLGETDGGVFRLRRDGTLEPVLLEVAGVALPPTNFVMEDGKGRLWVTVSTPRAPRHLGYRRDLAEGFIVLVDQRGARVVAQDLGYTNEVQIDPSGKWLYVNETFGRRLSRFRIGATGELSTRQTVTEFGPGTFPDGLAFDREGVAWVVSIVSNRVIRVDPQGRQEVVLEDSDPEHLDWVEAAYEAGTLGREHLDRAASRRLRNVSSLAFGGPDLKTIYLGCLLGDSLAYFRAPVAGWPLPHWENEV